MTGERLRRDPAVRWRSCVDGVVVMAPAAAEPLFLSSPGDEIWRLLATPRTIDDLVDALAASFDGERGAIAGDVASFVADLERAGLVGR